MKNKQLIIVLALVVFAVAAWLLLTAPDTRSTGEKLGGAIDSLSDGVDDAAKQLEDRTLGEKLGEAVEEAGEDISSATDGQ